MGIEKLDISVLTGKTITKIIKDEDRSLEFVCSDGKRYMMFHSQECCEEVYLEDICGDLDDLLNSEIINATESSNDDEDDEFLWTFYILRTMKGTVTLRWCGCHSDGHTYYSLDVDFVENMTKYKQD